MAARAQVAFLLCGLALVNANFVTERNWLKINPGKTKADYEKMLTAFHQKLATERAEDHDAVLFTKADLDGDGKHSKHELVRDFMNTSGFELHAGAYVEVGAKAHFDEIDRNKDGKVSLEEYTKHFKGAKESDFKRTDTDGDGFHTFEEQVAHMHEDGHFQESLAGAQESADQCIRFGDKDRDGKLTRDEKRLGLQFHHADIEFKDIDINADGFHTNEEIIAHSMMKHGFIKQLNGNYVEEDLIDEFARMDLDRDGIVTMKEFQKGMPKSKDVEGEFKKHDLDGDGKHSLDELAKHPSKASLKALERWTKTADKLMAKEDRNKDGKVSWDEFKPVEV